MLGFLKKEANKTYTENGAVTYATTMSECLDLFATIGALRNASEEDITGRFIKAYAENPDIATKILFYARDIRGGLGERRAFKTILGYLAKNEPETVKKNIENVAEYGRYDDLLVLMGTPCEDMLIEYLKAQLDHDINAVKEGGEVSLLAKWLPSVNASNKDTVLTAKRIARKMGYKDAAYRRTLSALRSYIKIIENNLREKDYTFDYEKQASKALYKYRAAFNRNDQERYSAFLEKAAADPSAMHTGTLTPYDVVAPVIDRSMRRMGFTEDERRAMDITWNALENFTGSENALAIVDGSGSMYGGNRPLPAAVAQSLGIYFAEHNTGAFKDCFIEFSAKPRLIKIKGDSFAERLRYVATFNEVANTNLEAVFEAILNAAVKNKVPQEELPAKLIIISDMEFDACVDNASDVIFKRAEKRFAEHGYKLPQIIFWNVASRNRQQPVKQNEQGVALISGATTRIFEMVAGGKLSPYTFMLEILEKERYAKIAA